jgi:hypothetical protein
MWTTMTQVKMASRTRLRLVGAGVLQREGSEEEGQKHHPVAVRELRLHGVLVEALDVVENVEAEGVSHPDRKGDQNSIDHLKKLLIEIMLPG